METPDKNLVKKRFSRGLSTYSGAARIQRLMAEKLAEMILRRRTRFNRVLEIGAGTGILTALLEGRISWNQRIVNDLVEDCASYHAGRRDTVFLPGDAEKLDWGNKPFDLICSNAAFQWLADWPGFLKKLKSSLEPEGLLAFTTFGPENLKELAALTGHSLPYDSVRQLMNELTSCGFKVSDSFESIHTDIFREPLEILRQMRQTGVSASSDRSWWTPRRLADFCRAYRERFGTPENQVKLTWHPISILAQNEGGNPR